MGMKALNRGRHRLLCCWGQQQRTSGAIYYVSSVVLVVVVAYMLLFRCCCCCKPLASAYQTCCFCLKKASFQFHPRAPLFYPNVTKCFAQNIFVYYTIYICLRDCALLCNRIKKFKLGSSAAGDQYYQPSLIFFSHQVLYGNITLGQLKCNIFLQKSFSNTPDNFLEIIIFVHFYMVKIIAH